MLKPILLVEDDPRDLELTLFALERTNLANEVVVVRDGSEALDYLFHRNAFANRPEGNPAIVLLDLKLPKVDGLEVLQAVRADPLLQSIPIAMFTSSQMDSDLPRAYELGVNAFVIKPIALKEFMQAVADLGMFWGVLNEPPPGSVRAAIHKV